MKKVRESKTIWINAIVAIVAILALLTPLMDTLVPEPEVKAKIAQVVVFVQGVLNVLLRVFFTKQPIGSDAI